MGVTAQSSPTMMACWCFPLLPLPPRRLFCPTGVLLAILMATLATLTPWPSPSSTRWRCPCPSCSTPPSTPAARTPSVTPCPASRRERRAGRDLLTRRLPRLPPLLPPSFHGLGLGYHGLGYAGLHYPYAVAAPSPVEVEVPVTQYKYVPEVKTVELPPACQNAFGFAVPCA